MLQRSRSLPSRLARNSPIVLLVKVAIPAWNGWISPVFDVARAILVVDVEDGTEVGRSEAIIEETPLAARAKRVVELGVNTLICGAISGALEQMLLFHGLKVIPHTCGPVEEVLEAFLSGQLTERRFLMPGCRGRSRGRGRRLSGRLGEGPSRKRRGFGPRIAK